jgi:hypothetical protein
MAIDAAAPKTRRAILAAGLGGLGAVAVQALAHPSPAEALANGDVQLGHGTADTDNDSGAETRVNGTTDGQVAFSAIQGGSGVGLFGSSNTGAGVKGIGGTTATGLWGQSTDGPGAKATSTDSTPSTFSGPSNRTGVIGSMGSTSGISSNTDEVGVLGYADASTASAGVVGQSHQGVGMFGIGSIGVVGFGSWGVLGDVGPTQIGVYGNTGVNAAPLVAGGIGVFARAETTAQVALRVVGKTQFNRSGRTFVAGGSSSRTVTMAGVSSSSYIIATPQTNRAGVFVQAVVPSAGKFVIYLNKVVSANTYVGYLVIN